MKPATFDQDWNIESDATSVTPEFGVVGGGRLLIVLLVLMALAGVALYVHGTLSPGF